MTTASDICNTCDGPHPASDGSMPRHPFNDGSVRPSATFGTRGPDGVRRGGPASPQPAQMATPPKQPRWPFDPVLRQALIDAGIITPQMLTDAEAKIRAVTAVFEEGSGNGD
jgi:hypothetical protein